MLDHPRYFSTLLLGDNIGQVLQLDRDPMTGLPYANLFALRRGKLAGHLSYANRGCSFCLVRMEEAATNPDRFIASFRAAFDIPPLDGPVRPVLRRLGAKFIPAVEGRPVPPDRLSPEDLEFLHAETDPAIEALLGYRA